MSTHMSGFLTEQEVGRATKHNCPACVLLHLQASAHRSEGRCAGQEARDLLAAALPPAGLSSLREFCSQQRRFGAGECSYALLSEQTHPLGSGTVSGFLFARTQPASYLTAKQVRIVDPSRTAPCAKAVCLLFADDIWPPSAHEARQH